MGKSDITAFHIRQTIGKSTFFWVSFNNEWEGHRIAPIFDLFVNNYDFTEIQTKYYRNTQIIRNSITHSRCYKFMF